MIATCYSEKMFFRNNFYDKNLVIRIIFWKKFENSTVVWCLHKRLVKFAETVKKIV